MTDHADIVIIHSLGCPPDFPQDSVVHALCTAGSCRFTYNSQEFELKEGDLLITRKCGLIENLRPSDDFEIINLVACPDFIDRALPMSNYGVKGSISFYANPIMHLDKAQRETCFEDFCAVGRRLKQTQHKFYHEVLLSAVQTAILDFYDFHSSIYGETDITNQKSYVMNRFIRLLEAGCYREHRNVSFYAEQICVTPKYLSEISKKVSGFSANYWIDRYAISDILRLLRDKSLRLTEISDMFGFSSASYFTRYVQRNIGLTPTQFRE